MPRTWTHPHRKEIDRRLLEGAALRNSLRSFPLASLSRGLGGGSEFDTSNKSYEIAQVIEASCELASTYHRGWSNATREFAKGPERIPKKGWGPENAWTGLTCELARLKGLAYPARKLHRTNMDDPATFRFVNGALGICRIWLAALISGSHSGPVDG